MQFGHLQSIVYLLDSKLYKNIVKASAVTFSNFVGVRYDTNSNCGMKVRETGQDISKNKYQHSWKSYEWKAERQFLATKNNLNSKLLNKFVIKSEVKLEQKQ
jgi:hypothetical protein